MPANSLSGSYTWTQKRIYEDIYVYKIICKKISVWPKCAHWDYMQVINLVMDSQQFSICQRQWPGAKGA